MKFKNGFSLIELLVVVAIMGVLAAVGLASYKTANMKSRDARRVADVQQLRSALEMYRSDSDEGKYPDGSTDSGNPDGWSQFMDDLSNYLSGQTIIDPLQDKTFLEETFAYKYNSNDGSAYTLTYPSEHDKTFKTIKNP